MIESAAELVAYANDYLDKLSEYPKDRGEATRRLREIRTLLRDMRRFNFHAPKFGIRAVFRGLEFAEKEEILEAMPFIEEMLYSLNQRTWTYERTKISYMAHKLAASLLEKDVMEDVLPYLPYDGVYLSFTDRGGGASYLVFRDLRKMLSGERKTHVTFENEVLTEVGREVRKGVFPTSVGTLLASYATKVAVVNHMDSIVEKEPSVIPNYEDVVRYESIVSKYDITKVNENPEMFWKLFQELEEKGFLEEDGSVRSDILNGVRKRRSYRYNEIERYAKSYLSFFLVRYYVVFTPWTGRGSPLRGVPSDIREIDYILSDIVVDRCEASREDILEMVMKARKVYGRVPLKWQDVARYFLKGICGEGGDEGIGRLVEEAARSEERAKKFLSALGEKDDKDKDTG